MSGRNLPRIVGAAGIVWGWALLARTDDAWRSVAGHDPDDGERLVTLVLGTRHLAQGVAQLVAPRLTRVPTVIVDVTHASSMVALATRRREYVRPALASGAVALVGAVLTSTSRGTDQTRVE